MAYFKQFSFKQVGYFDFYLGLTEELKKQNLISFIKIAFLKAGGRVVIDFKEYQLEQDALFFINPGQYYLFDEHCSGILLYYNRDFYCVEIHDKEVACDGILFHNLQYQPA
jgi:hypothetical protein